jgi:triosephosphate isomerase (TIM)
MRIPVIAGNWKMNTNIQEAVSIVSTLTQKMNNKANNVEIVICPPFVSLSEVKKVLTGSRIKLGAQNMYFEEKGAFTGEVSPGMLQGLCEFVILGHSERRQYFGETDEMVNKKVLTAGARGFTPILCVGENLDENELGKTEAVLKRQVIAGLKSVNPSIKPIIAYEPIWAIGSGKAASGKQANKTIKFIRNLLAGIWSDNEANDTRILYGGSVTEKNIVEFLSEKDIDGGLVGGASLKAEEFYNIVIKASELKKA